MTPEIIRVDNFSLRSTLTSFPVKTHTKYIGVGIHMEFAVPAEAIPVVRFFLSTHKALLVKKLMGQDGFEPS